MYLNRLYLRANADWNGWGVPVALAAGGDIRSLMNTGRMKDISQWEVELEWASSHANAVMAARTRPGSSTHARPSAGGERKQQLRGIP